MKYSRLADVRWFNSDELSISIGVEDQLPRVVEPSYNYLAFYQGGAVLDPHIDREACEHTFSLCIEATPDPVSRGAWPLHVMTDTWSARFALAIGDVLLFRGRWLIHWCDRLPESYTSSSVLFHIVEAPS
jgi:hypothetical protein